MRETEESGSGKGKGRNEMQGGKEGRWGGKKRCTEGVVFKDIRKRSRWNEKKRMRIRRKRRKEEQE